MPKLVPSSLRRLFLCAIPACALSLLAQRLVLAQRPSNALPPSARPAPTDEYYRGEAPYPTATPDAQPTPTSTPIPTRTAAGYDPDAYGTPQPPPSVPSEEDGSLEAFLGSEARSLKLSQVRGGWKSLRIVREASGSAGAAASTSGSENGPDPFFRAMKEKFGGGADVFLTRGRTLKLNGDDHLLVYQAQFPSREESEKWFEARLRPASQSSSTSITASQAKKVTRDFLSTIPLRASLVNTRHVAVMEAIEPFDFQARMSAFDRTIEDEISKSRPRQPSTTITPPARVPNNQAPPSTSGGSAEPRVVPVPDAVAQQASTEPLRRLFAAVQRYRADNGDVLPPMEDLAQVQAALSIYLTGGEAWRDPVSGRFFLPNARLSGRRMVHLKPFAQSLILFYSEADPSRQRMVLRLDGIIRRVSASEWDKLTGTSGVQ